MGLKVYISGMSGNKEVKKRQQRVLMILDSKNIKYDIIDITEPGKESEKEKMQTKSTSNGATVSDTDPKYPLPPQLFNEEEYCGDYDAFDLANEIDTLEQFLKLAPADTTAVSTAQIELKKENGDSTEKDADAQEGENKENEEKKISDENSGDIEPTVVGDALKEEQDKALNPEDTENKNDEVSAAHPEEKESVETKDSDKSISEECKKTSSPEKESAEIKDSQSTPAGVENVFEDKDIRKSVEIDGNDSKSEDVKEINEVTNAEQKDVMPEDKTGKSPEDVGETESETNVNVDKVDQTSERSNESSDSVNIDTDKANDKTKIELNNSEFKTVNKSENPPNVENLSAQIEESDKELKNQCSNEPLNFENVKNETKIGKEEDIQSPIVLDKSDKLNESNIDIECAANNVDIDDIHLKDQENQEMLKEDKPNEVNKNEGEIIEESIETEIVEKIDVMEREKIAETEEGKVDMETINTVEECLNKKDPSVSDNERVNNETATEKTDAANNEIANHEAQKDD